jgi:hypothetical protein
MFASYTRRFGGQKLLPFIEQGNSVWRKAYESTAAATVGSGSAHSEMSIHLLETWELSKPRRAEMPMLNDGMHWACISKQTEGASRCLFELSTHDHTRPDEVAWATVQLALDQLCKQERQRSRKGIRERASIGGREGDYSSQLPASEATP